MSVSSYSSSSAAPSSRSSTQLSPFDRLARPLQKWVHARGWQRLRNIQNQAITATLDSPHDILICAATAGGKTEAAFLPLITQVLTENQHRQGFSLVYIAPLKALINDQWMRVEKMCQYVHLPVTPWHGDISSSIKQRAKEHPHGVLLPPNPSKPCSQELAIVFPSSSATPLLSSSTNGITS